MGCPVPVPTKFTNNILALFGQGPAGVRELFVSHVASVLSDESSIGPGNRLSWSE